MSKEPYLIAVVFLFLGTTVCVGAETVSIATWNVRILSDRSRNDRELEYIATIVKRYDVVAIQEIRDERVFARLLRLLPAFRGIISDPVGRGVLERYAVVYRGDVVTAGESFLFPDPADEFIREPFVVSLRAGQFDFVLVTIHVIYGDSVADRRREIGLLDDVVNSVDTALGDEDDVILLGDFNRSAADEAWEMDPWFPLVKPSQTTTISERSSFDNIWIPPATRGELAQHRVEVFAFDELFFDNDDRAASLAVSDHRPVSTVFLIDSDDD